MFRLDREPGVAERDHLGVVALFEGRASPRQRKRLGVFALRRQGRACGVLVANLVDHRAEGREPAGRLFAERQRSVAVAEATAEVDTQRPSFGLRRVNLPRPVCVSDRAAWIARRELLRGFDRRAVTRFPFHARAPRLDLGRDRLERLFRDQTARAEPLELGLVERERRQLLAVVSLQDQLEQDLVALVGRSHGASPRIATERVQPTSRAALPRSRTKVWKNAVVAHYIMIPVNR